MVQISQPPPALFHTIDFPDWILQAFKFTISESLYTQDTKVWDLVLESTPGNLLTLNCLESQQSLTSNCDIQMLWKTKDLQNSFGSWIWPEVMLTLFIAVFKHFSPRTPSLLKILVVPKGLWLMCVVPIHRYYIRSENGKLKNIYVYLKIISISPLHVNKKDILWK